MSIIHNPEKSKKLAKNLVISALIILCLLGASYYIPNSFFENNPTLLRIIYATIPAILIIGIYVLIRKIEKSD